MIQTDQVCWPTVERAIAERIDVLHLELETVQLDRVPSIQGEIAGLRRLLKQAERPAYVPPSIDYQT